MHELDIEFDKCRKFYFLFKRKFFGMAPAYLWYARAETVSCNSPVCGPGIDTRGDEPLDNRYEYAEVP